MKRFAFLVHPLIPLALRLSGVPTLRPGLLLGTRAPRIPDDVEIYCRLGLDDVEGVVVGIPMLPAELLADQALALRAMERAAQIASPARVIGLGSVLAVVAGRGQALQEACGLPVTTGNVATTWAALHITRAAAKLHGAHRITVLGGRGAVGRAMAELLRADFDVTVDPPTLDGARFIVGANTSGTFLDPSAIARDAVIVDVSLPRTLSGRPRPDTVVYAGESVALPPTWRRDGWGYLFHIVAGYGVDSVYACLLEPLIAARLGRSEPFAQGRRIDVSAVRAFGAAAEAAGFRPELKRIR